MLFFSTYIFWFTSFVSKKKNVHCMFICVYLCVCVYIKNGISFTWINEWKKNMNEIRKINQQNRKTTHTHTHTPRKPGRHNVFFFVLSCFVLFLNSIFWLLPKSFLFLFSFASKWKKNIVIWRRRRWWWWYSFQREKTIRLWNTHTHTHTPHNNNKCLFFFCESIVVYLLARWTCVCVYTSNLQWWWL